MMEELLRANREYAAHFSLKGIPSRAAKGFALVACMDTRIEPLAMLGLEPGDAKILRNAGGRVTKDVLRSLVLATSLLGVNEVAVIHHTHCALANRSDFDIRSDLLALHAVRSEGWEFLAMADPAESLRVDVEAVRACELLPQGLSVEGWRYDVETGLITRVIGTNG